jgi:hypothetical protein
VFKTGTGSTDSLSYSTGQDPPGPTITTQLPQVVGNNVVACC